MADINAVMGSGAGPPSVGAAVPAANAGSREHDRDKARFIETPTLRVYKTVEEAGQRLLEQNPGIPADLLPTIAKFAVKPQDGGFVWKFDGWVLNRSSMEIRRDELPRFWAAVECPTLLVSGGESHLRIDPGAPVLNVFPDARLALIEGAQHWVHHDKFDEFVARVSDFFEEVPLSAK